MKSFNEQIALFTNSEGEKIDIKKITNGGAFHGKHLLCIHDDETPTMAMHLLDKGTVSFLLKELKKLGD